MYEHMPTYGFTSVEKSYVFPLDLSVYEHELTSPCVKCILTTSTRAT